MVVKAGEIIVDQGDIRLSPEGKTLSRQANLRHNHGKRNWRVV